MMLHQKDLDGLSTYRVSWWGPWSSRPPSSSAPWNCCSLTCHSPTWLKLGGTPQNFPWKAAHCTCVQVSPRKRGFVQHTEDCRDGTRSPGERTGQQWNGPLFLFHMYKRSLPTAVIWLATLRTHASSSCCETRDSQAALCDRRSEQKTLYHNLYLEFFSKLYLSIYHRQVLACDR